MESAELLKARVYYTEGDKAIFAFRYNSVAHTVVKVYEGGPAARAGLQQGDKIITIDNKPRLNWPDARSGDIFIFTILRQGQIIDIEITAEDPRDIKNPEINHIWIKN